MEDVSYIPRAYKSVSNIYCHGVGEPLGLRLVDKAPTKPKHPWLTAERYITMTILPPTSLLPSDSMRRLAKKDINLHPTSLLPSDSIG